MNYLHIAAVFIFFIAPFVIVLAVLFQHATDLKNQAKSLKNQCVEES